MENSEIYKKAKADIYRNIGKICAIIWTVILAFIWLISLVQTFSRALGPVGILRSFLISPLANLCYNPLLLISIFFFWRADVNENPNQRSKWAKYLLAYIGFYLLMSLLLSLFVAVYRKSAYKPASINYGKIKITEPQRSSIEEDKQLLENHKMLDITTEKVKILSQELTAAESSCGPSAVTTEANKTGEKEQVTPGAPTENPYADKP